MLRPLSAHRDESLIFLWAEYEFWDIEHGEHIQSRRSHGLELRGRARQR